MTATKLLEVYQRERSERFSLRRRVFGRQLAAAEVVSTRLLRLYTAVSDEIQFCEIHAEHDYADDEYMSGLRESIEELRSRTVLLTEEVYPFWLYFDVEDFIIFPDELSREMHEARLAVKAAFERWFTIHGEEPDDDPDAREARLAEADRELRRAYSTLATVLRKVRARYAQALRIVKRNLAESQALPAFGQGAGPFTVGDVRPASRG